MHLKSGQLQLSATDLGNYLGCNHLTWLNKQLAEGELKSNYRCDPVLELLIERGLIHEQAYVDHLKESDKHVVEIREFSGSEGVAETVAAMQAGVDVVVQASLADDVWGGRADFLLKTDRPSGLGNWSYEVADTKLSQNTRAGTILQLCLYSELIAKIQGVMPVYTFVVKPGEPFEIERFRIDDFHSYYRLVKHNLESSLSSGEMETTYPDTVEHCDVCRWWTRCNEIRRADDHLAFIAGISKSQIAELRRQGVNSLAAFAKSTQPLPERPNRGSVAGYERIHRQAKLQLQGRNSGKNLLEFNPLEESRGFCLLPEPNEADVYFDLEGDPHVSGGVLEYLFGCAMRDGEETQFHYVWCLNRVDEKTAFMDFMKFLMDRW